MTQLHGKTVVITGAGSGLGAAYARHAAALGAAILVNDIDPRAADATVAAIRDAGGRAEAAAGDVSDWDFAASLVDACVEKLGGITGLVNNAGILRPDRLENLKPSDLRRMWDVNVVSTVACASAAVRVMKANGIAGSIINVASGSQAGDIGLSAYGGTKAAIASMTYSWAMELRGTDIRINAISPLAETAMAAQNATLMAEQSASREVHYASLPRPEINAPLVCYLLSDAARNLHGQLIRIADRQLSFVTHPMIAAPVLTDEWDYAKIAAAFAGELGNHQQALGLGYARA